MKISKTLLLSAALLLVFSISVNAQNRRTIDVSGFDGVNLGGSGTVYITQGSSFNVEFEGSSDVYEKMKFEVRGSSLNIGRKKNSGWGSSGRYEVYITMPEIRNLAVSGSGKVIIEKTFSTNDLNMAVSGSGRVQSRVKASDVEAVISGSGQIEIIGEAKSLNATISGSGKVNGKQFTVADVEARISGSGSVYIKATESIESRISGSGNIYYSGDPKHLNNNSSGSGKIRKMD
jgi:hypothetical protein